MKRGSTVIWKHDRRRTTYSIIGFAVDEEGYPTVVYTPTEQPGKLHTRRCAEFFDGRYRQIEVDDDEEQLEDVEAMSVAVQSTRVAPTSAAKDGATSEERKRAIAAEISLSRFDIDNRVKKAHGEIVARRDTRASPPRAVPPAARSGE